MPNVEKAVPAPLVRQDVTHTQATPLDDNAPTLTQRQSRPILPTHAGQLIGKSAREPVLKGTLGRNAGLRNLELLLESVPLKLDRE